MEINAFYELEMDLRFSGKSFDDILCLNVKVDDKEIQTTNGLLHLKTIDYDPFKLDCQYNIEGIILFKDSSYLERDWDAETSYEVWKFRKAYTPEDVSNYFHENN